MDKFYFKEICLAVKDKFEWLKTASLSAYGVIIITILLTVTNIVGDIIIENKQNELVSKHEVFMDKQQKELTHNIHEIQKNVYGEDNIGSTEDNFNNMFSGILDMFNEFYVTSRLILKIIVFLMLTPIFDLIISFIDYTKEIFEKIAYINSDYKVMKLIVYYDIISLFFTMNTFSTIASFSK